MSLENLSWFVITFVLNTAKNSIQHARTKHKEINVPFVRDLIL